eukprot:c4638_g1_i1.p1 GENE.c4638_g1_i1~~c4638_g1_i1.p1  ORF type:complete len:1121 (+),score=294.65 c4638_g1_i1:1-3363(+)
MGAPTLHARKMEGVLSGCLSSDNELRRQAEQSLKSFIADPACISNLMAIVDKSKHPELRQLAALILRQRIVTHWSALPPPTQASIKSALLQFLVTEPQRPVRNAISWVAVSLCKAMVGDKGWPELWEFLARLISSDASPAENQIALKVTALYTLKILLADNVGGVAQGDVGGVCGLIMRVIGNPEHAHLPEMREVQGLALQALGSLVVWAGDNDQIITVVGNAIPYMINTMQGCLQQGEEDLVSGTFETLEELAESPSGVLAPHLPMLLPFTLAVSKEPRFEPGTRQLACSCLCALIAMRPKQLMKLGLLEPLLQGTVELVMEADGEREEDEAEEEAITGHKLGMQVVDTLCGSLNSKFVLPFFAQFIAQHHNNPDPFLRRMSHMTLAIIADGCRTAIRKNLDQYAGPALTALRDSSPIVRDAACIAIAQLAEYLPEEMASNHAVVLPALFSALHDPVPRVQHKACFAIEALAEQLKSDEIAAYLPQLVRALLQLLQACISDRTGVGPDESVRDMVVSALGAIATAAGEEFATYCDEVMRLMGQCLQVTDDSDLVLRARATQCIASVAGAVGVDKFKPYVPQVMQLALAGLELDFTELRETTYELFSTMAEVLREEFVEFTPVVLQWLFASCQSNDGVFALQSEANQAAIPSLAEVLGDDQNNEDGGLVAVRTAFLDEKVAAINAIGFIAMYTRKEFQNWVEDSLEILMTLTEYFHASVRRSVLESSLHVLESSLRSREVLPWVHGFNQTRDMDTQTHLQAYSKTPTTLLTSASRVGGEAGATAKLLELCFQAVVEDQNKEVAAQALQTLSQLFLVLGPTIQQAAPKASEVALRVLNKKTVCQRKDDVVQSDEGDDTEANDETLELLDGTSALIRALAKAFGPHAGPLLNPLFPMLIAYCGETRSDDERAMAIGVLAESVHFTHTAAQSVIQTILPIVLRGAAETSHHNLRNNCVFFLGVLFMHLPPQLRAQHLQSALQLLHQVFVEAESVTPEILDNACASVSRLILANAALLAQHTPQVVGILLQNLPLRVDDDEREIVLRSISFVWQTHPDAISPHISNLVRYCALELGGHPEEHLHENLCQLIRGVAAHNGPAFQDALGKLTEEERQDLLQAMQPQ